jgi:hypothetical protein
MFAMASSVRLAGNVDAPIWNQRRGLVATIADKDPGCARRSYRHELAPVPWRHRTAQLATGRIRRSLQAVTKETATVPSPTFFRRHRWQLVLGALLLVAVGVGSLWTLITLTFSYSDGDRVGYVQKFSHKGWLCRTWEGELAMTPVPGAAPQIFTFTVRDPKVVQQIHDSEGKKVALRYQEKKGIPSSCFGDTRYFISEARLLTQ